MNVRIFGPPGTGKTYALTQTIGHLLGRRDATDYLSQYDLDLPHGKYSYRDIVFMSHTNSAVDELLGRVGIARGYRSGLFGTMHGIALHLLIDTGAVSRSIVNKTIGRPGAVGWWKMKFAREVGIPYDPNEEYTTMLGNQFFQAYSKAVHVYFPQYLNLQRVIDKLAEEDDQFGTLAEDWIRFKKREKIFDFDDILALALMAEVHPERPVLVADEFQDFSPLQWEIFKDWMVDTDWVIVAGDDDQCIYLYSGASPRFILHEFPADHSAVLKRSFRLPSKILTLSRHLVEFFVRNRYPKSFAPRGDGGKLVLQDINLSALPRSAYLLASKGISVMILARTNSQVRAIEESFLNAGVPYYRFKTRRMQIWKDFVDRVEELVNLLRKGKAPAKQDLRFYFRLAGLDGPPLDRAVKATIENPRNLLVQKILQDPVSIIKIDRLAEVLGSEAAAELAKEALRARLSGKLVKPAAPIHIDTIHAAKGREADVVIIYDSITPRIQNELEAGTPEDFEAEVRVWYVAMTRARWGLVISRGPMPFLTPKLAQIHYLLRRKALARRG